MNPISVLLADDDFDDCLLFHQALQEVELLTTFTCVHNGQQLMKLLNSALPKNITVLFLDLNMPRKNGLECLKEIKANDQLKDIPVVIYSTALEADMIDALYTIGAMNCIIKPADFLEIKDVIAQALFRALIDSKLPTQKTDFILEPQK